MARGLNARCLPKIFKKLKKNFPNFKYHVALSAACRDNWTGHKGFIHQVLYDNYLKNHEEVEEVEYYCGPPMMIDGAKDADSLGVQRNDCF